MICLSVAVFLNTADAVFALMNGRDNNPTTWPPDELLLLVTLSINEITKRIIGFKRREREIDGKKKGKRRRRKKFLVTQLSSSGHGIKWPIGSQ